LISILHKAGLLFSFFNYRKKARPGGIKISIHADFYPRSLLRKLHQKPSVFAWKQRPPWRKASAFLITVKRSRQGERRAALAGAFGVNFQ
jgi:hypothetical protein